VDINESASDRPRGVVGRRDMLKKKPVSQLDIERIIGEAIHARKAYTASERNLVYNAARRALAKLYHDSVGSMERQVSVNYRDEIDEAVTNIELALAPSPVRNDLSDEAVGHLPNDDENTKSMGTGLGSRKLNYFSIAVLTISVILAASMISYQFNVFGIADRFNARNQFVARAPFAFENTAGYEITTDVSGKFQTITSTDDRSPDILPLGIKLGSVVETMFKGKQILVTVSARIAGETEAAEIQTGYFTLASGNSGIVSHKLGRDFKSVSFLYDVPDDALPPDVDYVAFAPPPGKSGMSIDVQALRISVVETP
jgi:hypothetical protein